MGFDSEPYYPKQILWNRAPTRMTLQVGEDTEANYRVGIAQWEFFYQGGQDQARGDLQHWSVKAARRDVTVSARQWHGAGTAHGPRSLTGGRIELLHMPSLCQECNSTFS